MQGSLVAVWRYPLPSLVRTAPDPRWMYAGDRTGNSGSVITEGWPNSARRVTETGSSSSYSQPTNYLSRPGSAYLSLEPTRQVNPNRNAGNQT